MTFESNKSEPNALPIVVDGLSEPLWLISVRIFAVIALYWLVSISMVFLNSRILAGSTLSLDAPLFITWSQCLVSVFIILPAFVLSRISSNASIPRIELHFSPLVKLIPLSLVFVCMITFNNLCLKHVGVPFYFVGRSLSIVFNVLLTYLILRRRTSLPTIVCCAAIIAGFVLGVVHEERSDHISIGIKAVVYCLCSSMSVALNSILISRGIATVDGNICQLIFYQNLTASFLFIPLIGISDELSVLHSRFDLLCRPLFWCLLALVGVLGFLMGYVTNLQIAYTSPLTHNISGTAKSCCQTVMATVLFGQHKSIGWWTSNAIVLFASAAYARVRQLEMSVTHTTNETPK